MPNQKDKKAELEMRKKRIEANENRYRDMFSPNKTNSNRQDEPKATKKPKIPWFAVGMALSQIHDAKLKVNAKERELHKQNKK